MNIPRIFGFDGLSAGLSLLLSCIIFAVFFFVIRELVAWYWKINRAIELLEKIEINTRKSSGKYEKGEGEKE